MVTLASKAVLNTSQSVFAYRSELPVSVAYTIVHLILLANAERIILEENIITLKQGELYVRQ